MTVVISDIKKEIAKKPVLSEISFSWHSGEIIALVGRNGAGKTTLLRTIANQIQPDEGTVRLNGRQIGTDLFFLDANHAFMNTEKVCKLPAIMTKIYPKFDASYFEQMCMDFNIDQSRVYGRLSKGEQAITDICLAISSKASFILLDEPFSGLDMSVVKMTIETIIGAAAEGVSFLIATHDLYETDGVFNRALIIKSGKLIVDTVLDEWLMGARKIRLVFRDGNIPSDFPHDHLQGISHEGRMYTCIFTNFSNELSKMIDGCSPAIREDSIPTVAELIGAIY